MNKKKYLSKILLATLLIVGFLAAFNFILAQTADTEYGLTSFGAETTLPTRNLQVVAARIINALLGLLGLIAVVLIIYGGVLYMTAHGEQEKVQKAKKLLIAALIGLVIVIMAFSIANFVFSALGINAWGTEPSGCTSGTSRACGCDNSGQQTCSESGTWGECSGEVCPALCPGGICPLSTCQNPGAADDPYICGVVPTINGAGGTLTISGGNFGDYTEGTSKVILGKGGDEYEAAIEVCPPSTPVWTADEIKVRVPADLPYVEGGNNVYHVFVQNNAKESMDNSIDNKLVNIFTLTNKQPTAGIICIVPPAAPVGTEVEIYGRNFGTTDDSGNSKIFFNQNVPATATEWSDEKITTTVPTTAIWGNVYARVNDVISAGEKFFVTCDNATGCASSCCHKIKRYSLKEVCDATLQCYTSAKVGDSCDGAATSGCQPNNSMCGIELVCADPDTAEACTCQESLVITGLSPYNGKAGNFVTIFGKKFGTYSAASKVIFLGNAADPNNIEKEASLPTVCGDMELWQDNQIIVEVPSGAISGPIKVISGSQSDATNDSKGRALNNFIINNTVRPGLCGAVTTTAGANEGLAQGFFEEEVKLTGKNFGPTKEATSAALLGGSNFNNEASWVWSAENISGLIVPNMKPAKLVAQVKVGEEYSNSVNYTVAQRADLPVIMDVDPKQGPAGQYITIIGSNFGTEAGKVQLLNDGGDWIDADTDFPIDCASKYWSDTQIVVRVPGAARIANGKIVVYNQTTELQSAEYDFGRCIKNESGCPLTPGICAIKPDNGPKDSRNIRIYGNNFGTYGGSATVTFSSGKDAVNLSGSWTSKQIGTESGSDGQIVLPEDAVSGPVTVTDSDGVKSNSFIFNVADCRDPENQGICTGSDICCQYTGSCLSNATCNSYSGNVATYTYSFITTSSTATQLPPQVVENKNCGSGALQSPSPWRDSSDACVNAQVYARFNQYMDEASFAVAGNILLASCASDQAGKIDITNCTDLAFTTSLGTYTQRQDAAGNPIIGYDQVIITPSAASLTKNTWYRVTLKGSGIKSATGQFLDGDKDRQPGGDYSWEFKTRNDASPCPVTSVAVTPDNYIIESLIVRPKYLASANAANCNMLRPDAYDWGWYKLYDPYNPTTNREAAQAIDKGGFAQISLNKLTNGNTSFQQTIIPLKQVEIMRIGAEVFAGTPNRRADDQNNLTIDLNLPEIQSFSPRDGKIDEPEVNAYVTIKGINFGVSGTVSFETATGWKTAALAGCPNPWTDEEIKVIVPQGIKDNSWIKVENKFGVSTSDYNNDKEHDPGNKETFSSSENVYPFLCALAPFYGTEGVSVSASGDNLGNSNKTVFGGKTYGTGSYIKFDISPTPVLNKDISSWTNEKVSYRNPLKDLNVPEIKVYAAITPYAEPYNDLDENGFYSAGDTYGDLNSNGSYDGKEFTKPDYVEKFEQLDSNQLSFYMPPVITAISPNNGPVDQWVTIRGRNFGYQTGEVWIGGKQAELAPCEIGMWHNDEIIAVVPRDIGNLGNKNVYVITKQALQSRDFTYTLNNNPIGAGLCAIFDPVCLLTNDPSLCIKTSGRVTDIVSAQGVRFGDTKESSELLFSSNVPAVVSLAGDWSDSNITAKIAIDSVSGDIVVTKKILVGQKCSGFSIGSWCSTNKFEDDYITVPSNSKSIFITGSCTDSGSLLGTVSARDDGFQTGVATTADDDDGNLVEYDKINLGPMATPDGKYMYVIVQSSDYNLTLNDPQDNKRTIAKIGLGKGGTILGKVYKKYNLDYTQNTPSTFALTTPGNYGNHALNDATSPLWQIIATPDGSLYSSLEVVLPNRPWLAASDSQYNKRYRAIAKIKLFDCPDFRCTYSYEFKEIPQVLNTSAIPNFADTAESSPTLVWATRLNLASSGKNIFNISADKPVNPTGYTIQVLDNNFKLVKVFTVKNVEALNPNPQFYKADVHSYATADDSMIYILRPFQGSNQMNPYHIQVVDWQREKYVSAWSTAGDISKEAFGAYDWNNQKFWFGTFVTNYYGKNNLLYRYSKCSSSGLGACLSDQECYQNGKCSSSICSNGQCTPSIQGQYPPNGPIGQWVSITGCYLGCDPGKVYFNKPFLKDSDVPSNGLVAGYLFNNNLNDITGNNNGSFILNTGALLLNASVSSGKLSSVPGTPTLKNEMKLPSLNSNFPAGQPQNISFFIRFKPTFPADNGYWTLATRLPGIKYFAVKDDGSMSITLGTTNTAGVCNQEKNILTATQLIVGGQWNTAAFVFNGDAKSYKLYINGALAKNLQESNLCFYIPPDEPLIGGKFIGEIEDLLLYKRELTQDEIKNLSLIQGATPIDDTGTTCQASEMWSCSDNYLNEDYDSVIAEVPQREFGSAPDDLTNDTISGTVVLGTGSYLLKTGNFIVDNSAVGARFCSCNNEILDEGELCDGSLFASGLDQCSLYEAPDDCTIQCQNCSIQVCDAVGEDCESAADLLCGNKVLDAGEQCDLDAADLPLLNGATCASVTDVLGATGTLGCYAKGATNQCKFDITLCGVDKTPPQVEKTIPTDSATDFCRNGIIDIDFNEVINSNTITKDNFKLGSCTGGPLVKDEPLAKQAFAFVSGLISKLLGYQQTALAVTCEPTLLKADQYEVTYNHISAGGKTFTRVSLELTGDALLSPQKDYIVQISGQVMDLAKNKLDYTTAPYGSKITIVDGAGKAYQGYVFGFTTDGTSGNNSTGICEVSDLSYLIYRNPIIVGTERFADQIFPLPTETPTDIFRCAGKNDCALPAILEGNTPADYDQESKVNQNQHAYKTEPIITKGNNEYRLSATFRWVKSAASDPESMLNIYNSFDDNEKDNPLVVQNKSGVTYATILPIKADENTSLLVAEAQARGSTVLYSEIFKVDYINCTNLWIFDEQDLETYKGYGSKTYYCRDKEDELLPGAGCIGCQL
ncbi:MAG: IPT/TIG domain-containing protein [Candidatus Parcubacteria bacterium]|nr:IPT/TIG domain-containing protein [Candidatus Parcubacteria bacterium]